MMSGSATSRHCSGTSSRRSPPLTKADGHRDLHNDPLVQKVAEANARLTAASLTRRSPIIKALVQAGQLKIAAAMHDVTTGKVTWLS